MIMYKSYPLIITTPKNMYLLVMVEMAIEIVRIPMISMVIFHSYVNVYQMGNHY